MRTREYEHLPTAGNTLVRMDPEFSSRELLRLSLVGLASANLIYVTSFKRK